MDYLILKYVEFFNQANMICCFQEAYAAYVKDYYIGKFGSLIETYDQQYLKNTTPGENSGMPNPFALLGLPCLGKGLKLL